MCAIQGGMDNGFTVVLTHWTQSARWSFSGLEYPVALLQSWHNIIVVVVNLALSFPGNHCITWLP